MRDSLPLQIVPLDVPGESFCSLPDLVRRHAAASPAGLALRDDRSSRTWAELAAEVGKIAAGLRKSGFGRGCTLAILADGSADYLVVYLAALAAGGCVAPLPALATDDTLARLVADSGAAIFVASEQTIVRSEAILDAAGASSIGRLSLACARTGWSDVGSLRTVGGAASEGVQIEPEDLFNVIYSSGTTGTPKGIVHDHRFRSRQLRRMREFGVDERSSYLVCTPMYSNTTLVGAFAALGNGGTLTVMARFDARRFLERVSTVRATHLILVPVLCQRLLAFEGLAGFDLSSVVSTTVTSAPLPVATKEALLRKWPGDIYEMYGLTEGGLTTGLDMRRFPDKLASVGLPSKTAVVRVVDERGREVPCGEVGEVIGRSFAMMRGYHRRPDLTEAFLHRHCDGHVYFRTGDLGRFDDQGFLYIVGRRKDVIISGGFNVYAVDLEEALLSHPDVIEASVVGVPSVEWGETPLGVVVLGTGARASASELRDFANSRLGRNQRLAAVQIADALPRNALGKVVKDELRRRYGA